MGRKKIKRSPSGKVRPVKSLGQNFLTDESIIQQIVDGSEISKETLVIEIGPGMGAITERLAQKAGRLVAIELDRRLIPVLSVKLASYNNIEIVQGDILQVDLNEIINANLEPYGLKELRFVGNIPYYITSPIIMRLLEMKLQATSITLMMQKEVADRLLAEPGTRAAAPLTYAVHYYAHVSKVVDVGRECFYPSPKVDSTVLRFDMREQAAVNLKDEKFYFECIKAGFMQRRKTLLNALSAMEGYDRERVGAALDKAGIEHNRRAESLNMQEFAVLAEALQEV